MITGTGASAISASLVFMENMKPIEKPSRIRIRRIPVICSEMKFFRVSRSEVQRWIMSPVLCFMCQEKGRRTMCAKSVSRTVFTRRSEAAEFATRKTYCAAAFISATRTTARAKIQIFSPSTRNPPSFSAIILIQNGSTESSAPPSA